MPTLALTSVLYGWMLLLGILVSIAFGWRRLRHDPGMVTIYLVAMAGAFIGAKLVYFGAEGWMHVNDVDRWRQWIAGKSITGALLGGYLTVELTKKWIGYESITGDWFAAVVPMGVAVGRVGCWMAGCCLGRESEPHWWTIPDAQGVSRWPAVPLEFGFNVIAVTTFLFLRRRHALPGQHFHLYLVSYGIFRFLHEYFRATPTLDIGLSGYQIAALLLIALGGLGFMRRAGRIQDAGKDCVPPTLVAE